MRVLSSPSPRFSPASAGAAPVDYLRDIKPLLTQNCVRCHGAEKQEGGLRVDTAASLDEGGVSGRALSPRRGAGSLLVRVTTGRHDDIPRMPYKKPPLEAAQIALLRAWIDQGARGAPADEKPGEYIHWSFLPPVRESPPAVKHADWPRNPIDSFILARLEQDTIAPSPEADRISLLRRMSLDLIGLPPTLAEVDAYLRDRAAGADERAVDRLLASPHYGERWARVWLDLARYADSNGYSIDAPRQIWKYREWVIDALNRDMPFDRFVIEQLAGDLLPDATFDQKVATGFNRNTQINQEGGIDPEQFRIEAVVDRVNTFGTVFLGLTVGCAQCHDHKFDPISQREYYRLFAFFNHTAEEGHTGSATGGVMEFADSRYGAERQKQERDQARAELVKYLGTRDEAYAKAIAGLSDEARRKLRSNVLAVLDVPWERQTLAQRRVVYPVTNSQDAEFRTLDDELKRLEKGGPTTLVMSELPAPRETFVQIKGDFTRRGEKVEPGVPAVLPALAEKGSTRLDLARWVVDPAHPLTARVFVNRVWQQYFGRGLVETENDFGTQGTLPTHPGLLDWLATELVAQRWSMKTLHRLVVGSATYRQSSRSRPDLETSDPTNRLLARQARLRLDAELIRDAGLVASGLLSPQIGGHSVFPPQPDGVMSLGQMKREWRTSTGPDRYRRGLYTHLWRATPHPALTVFDGPDGYSACTRRLRSNTPLQALTLLNARQYHEFAVALGDRVQRERPGELPGQIDYAFRLCLARPPHAEERQRLVALFEQQMAAASSRATAWTAVARVLLTLDETITRE